MWNLVDDAMMKNKVMVVYTDTCVKSHFSG